MNTGSVLYEKNADEKRLIASLTKIMTALVALENADPDREVTVDPAWTDVEGSKMGLVPGETMTVRDLLYGLLLPSGNDAALALADICAGNTEAFAALMNEKAAALGMTSTSFENPHGLDGDAQYSTARDMAALTAAAMKIPEFAAIVSAPTADVCGRTLSNHNKLLGSFEGTVGVKTGYTDAAGRTLVSCVEREGMKLVCVTLCDPDDWNDHKALCTWAFDTYDVSDVLASAELPELPVISGTEDCVRLCPARPSLMLTESGSEVTVLFDTESFIYAPASAGETIGCARIFVNGEQTDEVTLLCAGDVPLDSTIPLTAWEKLKWAWYLMNKNTGYAGFYSIM